MDEQNKRLEPFVGEWTMQVTFPGAPPAEGGRVVLICHDGSTWEHDFDLNYVKLS
jgi:hypothetical protein